MKLPVVPINAKPWKAVLLGMSDTWVIGWLVLGFFLTIVAVFIRSSEDPSPPGGAFRLTIFILTYWAITAPFAFPRWLSGYKIARYGLILPGYVENVVDWGKLGKTSKRLNVEYYFNDETFKAIASPFDNPVPGSVKLVAIRKDKPSVYRLVPYDFRLSKASIKKIYQELGEEALTLNRPVDH